MKVPENGRPDSLGVVTRQVPAACEQPDEAARGRHPDALANDEP